MLLWLDDAKIYNYIISAITIMQLYDIAASPAPVDEADYRGNDIAQIQRSHAPVEFGSVHPGGKTVSDDP